MSNRDERADRFKRIAQQRTNRILNDLRLLGNTSNKNSYEYTDEQIEKVFFAIDTKLVEIKGRFKRKKTSKFEL